MVKKYCELKNYTLVRRSWRTNFKNCRIPDVRTIKRTIESFNKTGSVASLPPVRSTPSHKREDAKNQLKEMFSADPTLSIRKASANTGISYGMVQKVLKEDLHLKSYKLQEWHQLTMRNVSNLLTFLWVFLKSLYLGLFAATKLTFILRDRSTVRTIEFRQSRSQLIRSRDLYMIKKS